MAFVAGLGLDRAAFEEVSQFAIECHKVILLYHSPADSPSGLLLLRTCIGPVWFCHNSATPGFQYFPLLVFTQTWPAVSTASGTRRTVDCGMGGSGLTYFL